MPKSRHNPSYAERNEKIKDAILNLREAASEARQAANHILKLWGNGDWAELHRIGIISKAEAEYDGMNE